MKAQPIPIGPWPKGVNLLDSPGTLEIDELSQCHNYRLNLKGYPFKRPGGSKLGSSPAKVNGDNIHNWLYRFYTEGGIKELLAIVGQKLYKLNDSTGAATQINVYDRSNPGATINLGTNNLNNQVIYKDRVYVLDGTQPIRYNGTDATLAGHYQHAVMTTANGPGGALTPGTYKYRIASVAGNMGEGIATGESTRIVGGGESSVALSNIDVAPARHEATAKRLYRTKVNGSVFYFLAELAAGAVSYNDLIADANLGSELITVHPPKATARFAVLGADDRVYWFGMSGADASLVEPSDPGFPDRIYDSEFFTIANNDGDGLNGGAKTPSGILFFKRKSCYLVRGFGSAPVFIAAIGCSATKSIVEVPGGVIFLSTRGEVYFYDGVNLNEIGKKIKPELVSLGSAGNARVVACYHDFRYILSYDYKGASGYNNRTLEYDLITGKWDGPHYNGLKLTPGFYATYDSNRDNNELVWSEGRAAGGSYIYVRREYAYMDDSNVKFISQLRTGHNNMGLAEKKFTKAFVRGRFAGDTNIVVSIVLDDEVTKIECIPIKDIGQGFAVFDVAIFDTDVFGDVLSKVGDAPLDISARARTPIIQLDDSGSSAYHEIEEITLLGSGNPLK